MSRLSMKTKIGYGLGDLAGNLVFQLTVIYLMFFYTDVLGISAFAAGMIFFIARLWDGINDPVMGLIMDRTKSKHGKARAYLLYGSLPLALATIAMFFVPEFSNNGKILYAAFTYTLWGMLFTMVNIPYSSLTASLTDIPEERTSLSSIRMIFMLVGVSIVSMVTEPLVSAFEEMSVGYLVVVILFSSLAFFFFIMCFKFTNVAKDREEELDAKYKLREIWPLLLKNKQLLIVTLASLIGNVAVFIRETAAIYYVSYNIGNGDLLPLFLGVVVLSMLLANLLIPYASKKWDKKGTYIIGSVIGIIGSIIFHFIPFDNIPLILLFASISSFGIAAISTIGWSMIPDTIEYGQWLTGVRAEGISYAIYSFSQKFATAIAGITVGCVLKLTEYIPNVTEQSTKTLKGILSTLTIIPIIFMILSIGIITLYKIDKVFFQRIKDDIQAKSN